jgi:CxxC motif-containing protein (DUF1111 family)
MNKAVLLVCGLLFFAAVACQKIMPGAPESGEVVAEPISGLTGAQLNKHILGDKAFAKIYTPEEGLGPIFVQASCEGCHIGDGKGHPINIVTRFGKTGTGGFDYMEDEGGSQLQPRAIDGFQGEVVPGSHMFRTDRLPPLVTGLGFLAAIHDSTILNFTDSLDADGDGVKGTVNYLEPEPYTIYNSGIHIINSQGKYVGRFGKKAKEITLQDQIVFALLEDIGLTTDQEVKDLFNPQTGSLATDDVADPEIGSGTVDNLLFYLRTLKAPTRRNETDADVISGEALFEQIGCIKCHIPSITTAKSDIEVLSEVEIHPYTDLLLHDMGTVLDDGFPEGNAKGSQWRTPPLWGLGLAAESQGGTMYLLHHGQASDVNDVMSYHLGGEANSAASGYFELSSSEKDQIIKFLMSL